MQLNKDQMKVIVKCFENTSNIESTNAIILKDRTNNLGHITECRRIKEKKLTKKPYTANVKKYPKNYKII